MGSYIKILDVLNGLSYGSALTQIKATEDEIKQGKNYLIASGYQTLGLMMTSSMLGKLVKVLPSATSKTAFYALSWVAFLAAGPACGLAGLIKQGDGWYKATAQNWNKWRYRPFPLPLDLREPTKIAASFFAEHVGNVARVAMMVISVALIVFGDSYRGGAILCAWTYESLNTLGYVPQKLALFVEANKPILFSVGLLWDEGVLQRTMGIYEFVSNVFPKSNQWLQWKIEKLIHNLLWDNRGPMLEELEAPHQCPQLSFSEMKAILCAEDEAFELNPTHFSYACWDQLPENRDLGQFLVLCRSVDWSTKYALVLPKLKDDERFCDLLKGKFPEILDRTLSLEAFEGYLVRLASEGGVSKEVFAANWIQVQMTLFVEGLLGKRPVKGSEYQRQEAANMCSKILPYLLSLNRHIPSDRVAFEDVLLKLAVEGGDYCGRGLLRAAQELLSTIMAKRDPTLEDPLKDYEKTLLGALQDERSSGLQRIYQTAVEAARKGAPSVASNSLVYDVHFMDVFRKIQSLGFCPVSPLERASIGLWDLASWSTTGAMIRAQLSTKYRNDLDQIVERMGELRFATYFTGLINSLTTLTKEEKAEIIELYTESHDGAWTPQETNHRAHRLVFVRLGVLRRKPDPGPYDRAEGLLGRIQLIGKEVFGELRIALGF